MAALISGAHVDLLEVALATESSASLGHSSNQSIVQQLISEGNMRQRTRKASPMGDMQSTMCRFSRTSCTKWA